MVRIDGRMLNIYFFFFVLISANIFLAANPNARDWAKLARGGPKRGQNFYFVRANEIAERFLPIL